MNYQLVQILSNQYIVLNGAPHTKVNPYDPTIVYMSTKHIPYVTVSLFILMLLASHPFTFCLAILPYQSIHHHLNQKWSWGGGTRSLSKRLWRNFMAVTRMDWMAQRVPEVSLHIFPLETCSDSNSWNSCASFVPLFLDFSYSAICWYCFINSLH